MCGRTKSNKPARVDGRGIDACLSEFIRLLNSKGVETIMSCCQHGASKPWVVMNVNSLRSLLNSAARQWVEEAHPTDKAAWYWKIMFCAEVCTPPRMDPCRNKTRAEIREQRRNFGFRRP